MGRAEGRKGLSQSLEMLLSASTQPDGLVGCLGLAGAECLPWLKAIPQTKHFSLFRNEWEWREIILCLKIYTIIEVVF